MADNLQFYPTPPDLVARAWGKFKNRDFGRMLEPSAGTGELTEGRPDFINRNFRREIPIDCFEIDMMKHPILNAKHLNVIGSDFFKMTSGSIYSHVLMNPPFADGVKHALKAWDLVWDAELVMILNAETIRNPYSVERQILVGLIEQHGEVEFIKGAFAVQEAERRTEVDVALVYLRKTADLGKDIVGDLLADLNEDRGGDESLSSGYEAPKELTLPNSFVENSVRAFNAATRAMRDAIFAEARARYYSAMLGDTMAVRNGDGSQAKPVPSVEFVQNSIAERYMELKDSAWSSVLRSTSVTSRLSSAAQKRVEAEFEKIKKFEFSIENIYGFLHGIIQAQGEIQIEMVCDVFDLIMRFHTDNVTLYKSYRGHGWLSNDKHRTCGFKVKNRRFILPGSSTDGWRSSLPYESMRMLEDFDKVFALVDGGKLAPEIGLADIFRTHFTALCAGDRIDSSYFACRYYPGAGTIHFFPKDQKLIDRFNRIVGRHRQWLPPTETPVSEDFWLQFEKSDQFDKEIRAEAAKRKGRGWRDNPIDKMISRHDGIEQAQGLADVNECLDIVLERHGISVEFQLTGQPRPELPLLAAA